MVSVGLAPAVAATTCRSQWRRDARVLGSPPLRTLGSLGPLPFFFTDATHAVSRVPPFCGSWAAFSLGCQPGSFESASLGRFWGRRPAARPTIAR